jgi:hypothetical protein
VTPVSGNLVVQSVATLNPLFQQLRVVAVFVQVVSRAESSVGAAKVLAASANRLAPVDREKNIMSLEVRKENKKLYNEVNDGLKLSQRREVRGDMKYGQRKGERRLV